MEIRDTKRFPLREAYRGGLVPSMQAFEEKMRGQGQSPEITKKYEKLLEGYHDLAVYGRREVYKIEG